MLARLSAVLKRLRKSRPETTPAAADPTAGFEPGTVTERNLKYGRGKLPKSASEPGSRVLSGGFFDEHQVFLASTEIGAVNARLNLRYEAIFAENAEILAGKRVLDISSHDGRWSYAALEAGAASVIGIEARADLVSKAEQNFVESGVDKERYRFIVGDVFDVLAKQEVEVDVVLCLGFLYHTLRYNELLKRIKDLDPSHLIIDTEVLPGRPKALVQILTENTERRGNAVSDDFSYGDRVLVGVPSLQALKLLAGAYAFDFDGLSDWTGLLRDNPTLPDVGDYRTGNRLTARFKARG